MPSSSVSHLRQQRLDALDLLRRSMKSGTISTISLTEAVYREYPDLVASWGENSSSRMKGLLSFAAHQTRTTLNP